MKFIKGFLFGSIVGLAAGMAISEERRVALIRQLRTASRGAAGVTPTEPDTPSVVIADHLRAG